jgi:hypothetical protein
MELFLSFGTRRLPTIAAPLRDVLGFCGLF